MTPYIPVPNPVTTDWLTTVLRDAGVLTDGQVSSVTSEQMGAFNSHTLRLRLRYSDDAPVGLPMGMILKRNIGEAWAMEAGAEEVKFYQMAAALHPSPPVLLPCFAAAHDAASGNSYLLLQDLSESHAPPVTRDEQVSIVNGVPSDVNIERVVDALARHHAYWWNHPLLGTETFYVGYWSRNEERFNLYWQRRQTSWESLLTHEDDWFPDELRELYDQVFAHLRQHWGHYLEPRFRTATNLTLVHGDSYFANFLCPKEGSGGTTYLLDWQSPVVDIGGYDLVNLCAAFWTPGQRHEGQREQKMLQRYLAVLQANGVQDYGWTDLVTDYQTGLIYWLLLPLQDRYGGAGKDYWWPKMQCLVAAFHEWRCTDLLGMTS